MSITTPARCMHFLLFLLLLLGTGIVSAQVTVAGQTLGQSTWEQRSRLDRRHYRIDEQAATPYKAGPMLRLEGALAGKVAGGADLFYGPDEKLVAATLRVDRPERLLARLAKSARASKQANDVYAVDALRMRIETEGGNKVIRISTAAFDAGFTSPPPPTTASLLSWGCLGLAALAVAYVLAKLAWRHRMALWARRDFLADHIAGLGIVGAAVWHLPETRLGLGGAYLYVYTVGYGLILTAALRTVRMSGWLPRKSILELAWTIPATPVLLVPVVVRNALKSAHYAGLVLLFAQPVLSMAWVFQGNPEATFRLLPVLGLLGAGVVRLYCLCFRMGERRNWHAVLCAVLALVVWPLVLFILALYFAWSTFMHVLGTALYMVVPAILLYFCGLFFESDWLQLLAIGLPFVGILPGVAGLLGLGLYPSGYSDLDFGTPAFNPATGLPMNGMLDVNGNMFGSGGFDVNPANGMPMFGGFDSFGNTFGSGANDPW